MSRARFGLLVALVALIALVGSFALGVALLDDDSPDEPPGGDVQLDAGGGTSTSAPPSTAAPVVEGLTTPTWVAVVSSRDDEAQADEDATALRDGGFPAGVLRSDDHESLTPGFWVAYTGPYENQPEAEAAVQQLAERGVEGAYARCVGTAEQCGSSESAQQRQPGRGNEGRGNGESRGNGNGEGEGGGNGDD